jgi:hypothetical protein
MSLGRLGIVVIPGLQDRWVAPTASISWKALCYATPYPHLILILVAISYVFPATEHEHIVELKKCYYGLAEAVVADGGMLGNDLNDQVTPYHVSVAYEAPRGTRCPTEG